MSVKEKVYDEEIAPKLLEIANKCQELGLSMVARVEWGDNGAGITTTKHKGMGIAQILTKYAAYANGNFDALTSNLLRDYGCGQSIYLRLFSGGDK